MDLAVGILSTILACTLLLLLLTAWSNRVLKNENAMLAAAVELLSAPTPLEHVSEFHRAFGAAIRNVPNADIPAEERELRVRLIEEEFNELKVAIANKDIVEIADALGDLLYVVHGAALTFGIDLDAVVDEIHDSNMSKLGENGQPVISDGTDGYPKLKVLKGPNFFAPNIAKVLNDTSGKNRPTRSQIARAVLHHGGKA